MPHLPCEPSIAGGQAPPPYDATDVRVFGFPLNADAQRLRALCRQFLDLGADTFEPVSNTVILEVLDYLELKARTPPWDVLAIPQQELLFSIPVRRFRSGKFVEFGIFMPYIFVDDQSSAFTGREVLGLPKMLALFNLDRDQPYDEPISLSLQTRVRGGTVVTELIKIREAVPFSSSEEGLEGVIRFFGPLDLYKEVSDYEAIKTLYRTNEMIGFSSRVLIDPNGLGKDPFRSVHRCRYSQDVRFRGYLRAARVALKVFGHLDIATALGLNLNPAGEIPSVQPYKIDSNFCLDDVTTL